MSKNLNQLLLAYSNNPWALAIIEEVKQKVSLGSKGKNNLSMEQLTKLSDYISADLSKGPSIHFINAFFQDEIKDNDLLTYISESEKPSIYSTFEVMNLLKLGKFNEDTELQKALEEVYGKPYFESLSTTIKQLIPFEDIEETKLLSETVTWMQQDVPSKKKHLKTLLEKTDVILQSLWAEKNKKKTGFERVAILDKIENIVHIRALERKILQHMEQSPTLMGIAPVNEFKKNNFSLSNLWQTHIKEILPPEKREDQLRGFAQNAFRNYYPQHPIENTLERKNSTTSSEKKWHQELQLKFFMADIQEFISETKQNEEEYKLTTSLKSSAEKYISEQPQPKKNGAMKQHKMNL